VENGTIVLIGATTENPFFEVNKALVSRSRLFQLKPLTTENLRQVLLQALQDDTRGYGQLKVTIDREAIDHLANVANGDARSLLNALELAVETTTPAADGTIAITLAVAEESIQQRAVLYDKEGDTHFDTISALIKSVRGSDPDAALYWLAKMVYAGEEPRFILRRLLILASEDIGLADPQAVVVVNACAQAFDLVGLPEGRYPIASWVFSMRSRRWNPNANPMCPILSKITVGISRDSVTGKDISIPMLTRTIGSSSNICLVACKDEYSINHRSRERRGRLSCKSNVGEKLN
jgi:putative ATPase